MARKSKRKTPEQIAAELIERRRKDFEAVNLDPDTASLPAYAGVQIERAGKASERNRVWRSNVFRLLYERKTITKGHKDAAEILSEAWAAWKGLDGKADTFGQYVDGGRGCAEMVTDRMIRGGREVASALRDLDVLSDRILREFMKATVEEDRPMAWRGILERCGVRVRDRQTEAVVYALEALRRYYQGERVAA